jgi:hypothetical protein
MWEKIKAFFAKIWNWIKGLFGGKKTEAANIIKETEIQVAVVEAMETGNVPNEFKDNIAVTANPNKGAGEPPFFAKWINKGKAVLNNLTGNNTYTNVDTNSYIDKLDKYGFGIEDSSKLLSNISEFGFRYMGNPNNIVNDAIRFHMKMKGVEKSKANEIFSILDNYTSITKEIRSKKEIPSTIKNGIKNNIIDLYKEMTKSLKTSLNAIHDKSPNIDHPIYQFVYFTSNIPEFRNFGMDMVLATSDEESLNLAKTEYTDDVDGFKDLLLGPLTIRKVKSKEHLAVENQDADGPSWDTIKKLCAFEKNYIKYLKSDKDIEILISKTDTLNKELELLINELIDIAESNVEFSKDAKVFINMGKTIIKFIKVTVDVNYEINHNFLFYLNSYTKKSLKQWTMWPASNPVFVDTHKASMGAMKHIRENHTFSSRYT